MTEITRRDFLNGTALTIAAGLTPLAQIAAAADRYPPALTGLRGQHAGSFETAHQLARERGRFDVERLAPEESYDLVVVGAGISGLAAAWFYRRAAPAARPPAGRLRCAAPAVFARGSATATGASESVPSCRGMSPEWQPACSFTPECSISRNAVPG